MAFGLTHHFQNSNAKLFLASVSKGCISLPCLYPAAATEVDIVNLYVVCFGLNHLSLCTGDCKSPVDLLHCSAHKHMQYMWPVQLRGPWHGVEEGHCQAQPESVWIANFMCRGDMLLESPCISEPPLIFFRLLSQHNPERISIMRICCPPYQRCEQQTPQCYTPWWSLSHLWLGHTNNLLRILHCSQGILPEFPCRR